MLVLSELIVLLRLPRLLRAPLLIDWIWLIGTLWPLTVTVGGFWLMLTPLTTPCTCVETVTACPLAPVALTDKV